MTTPQNNRSLEQHLDEMEQCDFPIDRKTLLRYLINVHQRPYKTDDPANEIWDRLCDEGFSELDLANKQNPQWIRTEYGTRAINTINFERE